MQALIPNGRHPSSVSIFYLVGLFLEMVFVQVDSTVLFVAAFEEKKIHVSTDVMDDLYNYFNPKTQSRSPMISTELHDTIVKNAERLNSAIIYDRDYSYNYFGFKVNRAKCDNRIFNHISIMLYLSLYFTVFIFSIYIHCGASLLKAILN